MDKIINRTSVFLEPENSKKVIYRVEGNPEDLICEKQKPFVNHKMRVVRPSDKYYFKS